LAHPIVNNEFIRGYVSFLFSLAVYKRGYFKTLFMAAGINISALSSNCYALITSKPQKSLPLCP